MEPCVANEYLHPHVTLLCTSFRRWTGRDLVAGPDAARALWEAPFPVVSHGTQADPIFNYGNRAALARFGYTWAEFTLLPSRLSAEPVKRDERARLLAEVTAHGFIANYAGWRIAKNGERFLIQQGIVWNVVDAAGAYLGQAAKFTLAAR
jgi:hypothetical protein